jgi:exonuclease III
MMMAPSGAKVFRGNSPGASPPCKGVGKRLLQVNILFAALLLLTSGSGSSIVMYTDYQIPKFTFSTINCNSLNMSSLGNNNHLLKIYGITSLKADIILLSDIRMCNSSGMSNLEELRTSFKINPHCSYKFYHNSKSNKRGVGILIKYSLSIAVLDEKRDPHDNYLALHLEFEGKKFTVCSIYGPNQVQPAFFTSLQECVSNYSNYPIVIGGDWNCTVSCEPAVSNIDTLNMQNPPNL